MQRVQVVRPYIGAPPGLDRWSRAADLGWDLSNMEASATATAIDGLRRAAVRATWAYSAHNTQPWRLRLAAGALHVHLDQTRRLNVADPAGRLMTISLGCALFNVRASLAADGVTPAVERWPGAAQPDLVASVRVGAGEVPRELAALGRLLDARFCDQRLFFDDDVTPTVLDTLRAAAADESTVLAPVSGAADRESIAALSMHADVIENLNPAYRAERRAWGNGAGEEIGALPQPSEHSLALNTLVVLGTRTDTPTDWLRAGEALERVLLEAARAGYATRVHTQLTEVPSVRSQVRRELGNDMFPHLLVRIGRAPAAPQPGLRRLVDVLTEDD